MLYTVVHTYIIQSSDARSHVDGKELTMWRARSPTPSCTTISTASGNALAHSYSIVEPCMAIRTISGSRSSKIKVSRILSRVLVVRAMAIAALIRIATLSLSLSLFY